jgi:transcription attenuation protein (tryptophan RNA-binding attenuator protein)
MYQHTTIIIKALEDGVIVLFSSGENAESFPPERLDNGEVLVLPVPERHPAIRIRGHAEVYTPEHIVEAESSLVIGGRSQA